MGIQNSPLIEVAIGLVLLYLVFGLICTAVNELVAQAFSLRSETLWGAVRTLLHDPNGTGAARDLYNHHLIRSLAVRNAGKPNAGGEEPNIRAKPSYVPATLFSLALVDMISNPESVPGVHSYASTNQLLASLPQSTLPEPVQQALIPLIQSADGSMDQARANIEDWYDAAMERASGWYKQRIQKITLFVAFLAVFFANADTIMVADRLWANPVERSLLVEAAKTVPPPNGTPSPPAPAGEKIDDKGTGGADSARGVSDAMSPTTSLHRMPRIPSALQGLLSWSGPVDWHARNYIATDPRRFPQGFTEWLVKLLGLLLTVAAASLGAPFWFDVLNKVMNIRASGPSPAEALRQPGRKLGADARIPTEPQAQSVSQPAASSRPEIVSQPESSPQSESPAASAGTGVPS
jgi:hypothetical protein